MDGFYIITNKLKDPDFAVTNEIRHYIESRGRNVTSQKKTAKDISSRELSLQTHSAALFSAETEH